MASEDWGVMLAKKPSKYNSELPTRPVNERPLARFEEVPPGRTHLMLVRTPSPTLRSLAWARRDSASLSASTTIDASRLESMLRLERLNLG